MTEKLKIAAHHTLMQLETLKIALRVGLPEYCAKDQDELLDIAITTLKESLGETPYEIGTRIAKEGGGVSSIWGAVLCDSDIPEAHLGYQDAIATANLKTI